MIEPEVRRLVSLRTRERRGLRQGGVSAYRSMWLVVLFDLPVGSQAERRAANRYRHLLQDEGFVMKQWSVYVRYFDSRAKAEAAADRLGAQAPPMGLVSMLFLTDKQYGLTRNFEGAAPRPTEKKPEQLALF
ncbi:CRISPR-associated endonuclease Cas2 [Pararhodospirillum oryzae]|uniref:CRISPR-associated endoribonuclease Cas2 n=1 Tax=Pararhodospirillum oryzae TaxID=478448 RepID=A0A512H681_9PROT|nr:CRISPR-associated endonuclease Cas2 [Pararhodospirillum oryzae]GEO80953.1 hypothetical protein ROR02_10840 [Pararhodospirillum oryzae]